MLATYAAVALLAAPASAASVDRTVQAGSLRATVTPDPWRVTYTQAGGATLQEGGPGLGFSSAGVRFAATRVSAERREGEAYVATVATNDPLGRTLEVTIAPDADGVIRVTVLVSAPVDATGAGFMAETGERFLGFGERSNAVDQRGADVHNHVAEGPYQPLEEPFIAGFVPLAGYDPRPDSTYFPIPWLLSTRGYGVLLDNDDDSVFHLAAAGSWSAEVNGSFLALRVFAGPTPALALGRFSARVGRQPRMAAPWFLGPWWQPKGTDKDNLANLRAAGALGSVVQTYTHYLPCGSQQGARDQQKARTAMFHAAGLAVTTYFNPMICTDYGRFAEAEAAGVLTRNLAGQTYVYRYTGASQFIVGQFDFSAPGAAEFYGRLLGEAVDDGYDGWMEDFGEYTPPDSVSADGKPGPQEHNRYPTLYHGAARAFTAGLEPQRPLARFNRSGWTGTARVAQIVWGGDPSTGWGFDGLQSAVRNGLSMGLSGVSLWGSDIGGYFALSLPQTTPELLARWIEVGFASGVMRTEADGFDLTGSPRAQIFDAGVLPVWSRYSKLRTQLYPYLAAAQREYDRTGLPIMRHLALRWPGDPRAAERDDEYLFGPSLLAAPVLLPGAKTRALYLPEGRWVDLWRSVTLGPAGEPRLSRARVLRGGTEVAVPAPLDELPLLARAGTLLALLTPDVQTLSGYGKGVVHLNDRRARMRIVGWPVLGKARIEVDAGETFSVSASRRALALRVRGKRVRRYSVELSLAALPRSLRPRCVIAGTRRLRFRYDRANRVLRFEWRARSSRAVVHSSRRACHASFEGA